MKKSIFLLSLFAFCLQLFAGNLPSNTRLRVAACNVANYLSDFEASNASCTSQSAFDEKTNKMATLFVNLQADIVALCEVQQDDDILGYIVDAMNNKVGTAVYDYVLDGSKYNNPSPGSYGDIKCGYIYRRDKIIEGNRYSTNSSDATFKLRMQVICFTEKSTKEKFVLSLNHLQSKKTDTSGAKRKSQATTLVSALKNNNYGDPDILIVGDLNAETTEDCLSPIMSAGYEEQLLRFDSKAYSYVYLGARQLIDHALANSTMAEQVTGAYVDHSVNFSDHDCVVVGLDLGNRSAIDYVIPDDDTTTRQKIYRNGQIYIQVGEHLFDVMGRKVE